MKLLMRTAFLLADAIQGFYQVKNITPGMQFFSHYISVDRH
jgi:hypothetical protein